MALANVLYGRYLAPTPEEMIASLPTAFRERQSVASDETFAIWLRYGGGTTLMEFVTMLNPQSLESDR